MDESYYINASLRILSGEIFLQNTQFDKPFLTAWLPIPGIVLFGENAIGFHFVHFIFYLGLGPLLRRLILSVFLDEQKCDQIEKNYLTNIICFFVTACLVLHPWTILFCAGAFSEGAFLFGVTLYLWLFISGRIGKSGIHLPVHLAFLALLFYIKQTAFLLFTIPITLFTQTVIAQKPRSIIHFCSLSIMESKAIASKFFSSKLNSLLFFSFAIYCLFGPKKFFPILRIFQQGGETHLGRFFAEGIFNHWTTGPTALFGGTAAIVFLIPCLFSSIRTNRTSQKTLLIAILVSISVHFVALGFSQNVSSRYVLFFWIHVLTLFRVFEVQDPIMRFFKHSAVFCFGLSILGLPTQWHGDPTHSFSERLPEAKWDRIFAEVRDLLPKNTVVHNNNLSWYLAPYNVKNWVRFASAEQVYIEEEQVGRKRPFFQYMIKGKPESDTPSTLLPIQKNQTEAKGLSSFVTRVSGRQARLTEKEFKASLRLRSWETVNYT